MKFKKSIAGLALATYIVSSTGCGMLLHPERQGQSDGRIDPAVAILDGIGLLFFLVPGLVAFAVDFHTGTIYLPNSQAALSGDSADGLANTMRAISVEGEITEEKIEQVIQQELGLFVDVSAKNVQVSEAESLRSDILPAFAAFKASTVAL